ncbi:MAG: hypothetical protein LBC43_03980 [Bifidobacteriaceae bacterium]|jgi:hypothetical protein|nr:hypothetical protein [Bifidobacteriaceae bacterium]
MEYHTYVKTEAQVNGYVQKLLGETQKLMPTNLFGEVPPEPQNKEPQPLPKFSDEGSWGTEPEPTELGEYILYKLSNSHKLIIEPEDNSDLPLGLTNPSFITLQRV